MVVVRLPAEIGDVGHHLVGRVAQLGPGVRGVRLQPHGSSEPDRHSLSHAWQPLVRGLELVRADKADGQDRRAGCRGQPRGAEGAAVEHPVAGASPLGVDADDTASGEHAERSVDCPSSSPGVTPPKRDLSSRSEDPGRAAPGEVLRLRQERNGPVHHQGQEDGVHERTGDWPLGRRDHPQGQATALSPDRASGKASVEGLPNLGAHPLTGICQEATSRYSSASAP